MSSPDATWRVYLAEWLIVWTSDADGPEGVDECWDYFERKYKGRVREEDRRVVPAIIGRGGGATGPYCVQLRLPNLQGEYKDEADARELSVERVLMAGEAVSAVQRGSA